MLHRYASVLRTPGAVGPLTAVLAGSAAIGMLDLALLLLAHHLSGSLAVAGAVTAAFGVGNALGLPLQGWLMDRLGPGLVAGTAGVVCAAALSVTALVLRPGAPAGVMIGLTAVAGLNLPATTAGTRVLLRDLFTDADGRGDGSAGAGLRQPAYALLGVLFQLGFLIGPVLVSGLLVATGPRTAVLVAGALACGSGLLFARAPAARRPPSHTRKRTSTRTRRSSPDAGPPTARGTALGHPGVRTLVFGSLAGGLASGLKNLGVPAVALARDAPALGGVLLTVGAVGTMLGGLAFGARMRGPESWGRQLFRAQVAATGLALVVLLSASSLPVFGLALFVFGATAAPVILIASALLDVVAAPHALTQAYALLACLHILGVAAGYSLGGVLSEAAGPAPLFACAAAALACTAAWSHTRRRTLAPLHPAPEPT